MEILHVFGIEWKLITIQMINFGVLLYILHRFAYKPLLAMIEKRQWMIDQGLDTHEEVKQEKKKLEADREHILARAREDGAVLVSTLRKDGEEKSKVLLHEAEEKARAVLKHAQEQALQEKNDLMKESEKELAKLFVLGVEKVLKEQPTKN